MQTKPTVVVVMWEGNIPLLSRIVPRLDFNLELYSQTSCDNGDITVTGIAERIRSADLSIIYCTSKDFFERLYKEVYPFCSDCRIVCLGNLTSGSLNTVDPEVTETVFKYLQEKCDENCYRMFDYLEKTFFGKEGEMLPIIKVPKQSLVNPKTAELVDNIDNYLETYCECRDYPSVVVLCTRTYYQEDELKVERELCSILLEHGMVPILLYTGFTSFDGERPLEVREALERFCYSNGRPVFDAVVKLSRTSLNDRTAQEGKGLEWLKDLDVPVFRPIIMGGMTVDEWEESDGLGPELSGHIYSPEREGSIEPIVIGSERGGRKGLPRSREGIPERMHRVAERVKKHILLRKKDNSEKKVVIFLNNYPCVGAESNVGNALDLDSLESTVRLLRSMEAAGYRVDVPSDGAHLLSLFMERKALTDFRWTTASEISRCGGTLYEMGVGEYNEYFLKLSQKVREDIVGTWGEPPGQAMTLDEKILITGLDLGNVIVAVQPKRGCYGSRCDGEVCKILQDPKCPPTHQFLATYHYYEDIWGADAVIHMGTHGCLEYLPGKGTALSADCYPDLVIANVPNIYPYNIGSTSSALVAKRRIYGITVDHMGPSCEKVKLYGVFEELNSLIVEYETSVGSETRRRGLEKALSEKSAEAGFDISGCTTLEELIICIRENLSRMTSESVNRGTHVLGDNPAGQDLVDIISSILEYGTKQNSLRWAISSVLGLNLKDLLESRGEKMRELQKIESLCREFVEYAVYDKGPEVFCKDNSLNPSILDMERLSGYHDKVILLRESIGASTELESILRGLSGRFIPPGQSGRASGGDDDIFPSGRNMCGMNPDRIPTRTAWVTGCQLADVAIEKYQRENGSFPETIGIFWMLGEQISTGGEQMCQVLSLMGVEPVWENSGKVNGFRVIPLSELGRPRVDITINVSSTMRDGMREALDYVDSVVDCVSDLDEPLESNYIRKHTLELVKEGMNSLESKSRIFGAPPGVYTASIGLAVYASAWKDKKDLVNMFINSKGYAYGGKRKGEQAFRQFSKALARTSVSVHKISSPGSDAITGSSIFSNIGGIAAAAEYLSGKKVGVYCSDTSDPDEVSLSTMSEQIEKTANTKLFNPQWIEGMKKSGYRGASDISKKIVSMFGWQSATNILDDRLFDRVVETYVKNEENRRFFHETNPFAMEELERRLLEANSRGIWKTSEDILECLKNDYLEIESDLEGRSGDGEFQGGNVDIITSNEVDTWKKQISKVSDIVEDVRGNNDS